MVWEKRPCAFCGHFAGHANDSLGPLIGPVGNERTGEEFYVHRLCALWSPEVYQTDQGTLCGIMASIRRSRAIRCSMCSQRGASIGCRVEKCSHSFHLQCAGKRGCLFNADIYMVACPMHAAKFKQEVAQQRVGLQSPEEGADGRWGQGGKRARAGEALRRQKRPLEEPILRARAAAKRARMEARERAAESSDDEEHFQRKEHRRLARDKAKLNPLILGGKKQPAAGPQSAAGAPPEIVQTNVPSNGWAAVGGLGEVVKQLKEMVLLPLIYPELFRDMGLTPPRGILFHGVPGTGKTLVARALAGACAQHSPTPVAFFARKGADCLGKFSGEAERTLRLLFEEAAKRAPSIIFLDELDGLVPARSTREGSSDQIYASVVSSLLALMDGAADRGAVVVIGATNRPEAIDPALRRPGRFDREVYFGLPSADDRAAILKVHTSKWEPKPSQQTLATVAAATDGFAGADLQALCAAAVMAAVRRSAPRLVDHLEGLAAPAQIARGSGAGGEDTPVPSAAQAAAGGGDAGADGGRLAELRTGERDVSAAASALTEPVPAHAAGDPDAEAGGLIEYAPAQAAAARDSDAEAGGVTEHMPAQAAAARDAGAAARGLNAAEPAGPRSGVGRGGAGGDAHRSAAELLENVAVRLCDWRTALAQAPAPCSRRQGMASVAADYARSIPHHLQPILLPAVTASLKALHSAGLPLPIGAAAAAKLAVTRGGVQLEENLVELGAFLQAPDSAGAQQKQPASHASSMVPAAESNTIPGQQCYHPCRLLLAGMGEMGQEVAAGALLRLLDGLEVHVISLPLLVAGGGDACQGCVTLVQEALRRASSQKPCVFYLPRLEAWAQNTVTLEDGALFDAISGDSPAGPASAKRQSPPSRFYSPGASVFRGLVSLEERVHESPAAAWTAATPRTPRSAGTGTPRGSSARRVATGIPRLQPSPPEFALPGSEAGAPASQHLPQCLQPADNLAEGLPRIQTPRASQGIGGNPKGISPEGSEAAKMEAVVLSEVWKVFEQLMKEVPASQPVIILATCHCNPAGFPAALEAFFTGRPVPLEDAPPAARLDSDSPWVVAITPAGKSSWEQALLRAADAASSSLAMQGAEALCNAVDLQSSAAELADTMPTGTKTEISEEDSAASKAWEEEVALLRAGAQLFAQVAGAIQSFAAKMASDTRADTAAVVLTQRRGAREAHKASLADVALRARQGRLPVLADFLAEIDRVSAAVRASTQTERGYSARAAAASALHDEAQHWAQALTQRLRLTDPANLRALRAAEAKVKAQLAESVQRKEPSPSPPQPPVPRQKSAVVPQSGEQAGQGELGAARQVVQNMLHDQHAEQGKESAGTQRGQPGAEEGPSEPLVMTAGNLRASQENTRLEAGIHIGRGRAPDSSEYSEGEQQVEGGSEAEHAGQGASASDSGRRCASRGLLLRHTAAAFRNRLQEPLRAAFLASSDSGSRSDVGRLEAMLDAAAAAGYNVLLGQSMVQELQRLALSKDGVAEQDPQWHASIVQSSRVMVAAIGGALQPWEAM